MLFAIMCFPEVIMDSPFHEEKKSFRHNTLDKYTITQSI